MSVCNASKRINFAGIHRISLFLKSKFMRQPIYLVLIFLWGWITVCAQKNQTQFNLEVNYYYGSIIPHNQAILHLITAHPEGVFISANRKTFGDEEWESRLNYPDFGLTFHFQNNKNETLGDMYGLFAHYNFYFLKRNLQLRIGQGIAYNTNPYDKEENYRNIAYGTHLMPATFFMLNFQQENIWEGLGFRTGLFLIHHSNGAIKSPNFSTNTVGANIGLQYTLDYQNERIYIPKETSDSAYSDPIRYNFALRFGIQESHITGSGQYPYYAFSAYADKRINRSSAIQAGIDIFLSMMQKHEIQMMAVSYPEFEIRPDTDYKRVGLFVGYEMLLKRLSFEAQLGAYVYDDYKANAVMYQRLGLKYNFYKNLFLGMGLKTHLSKAEVVDFSLGIRL